MVQFQSSRRCFLANGPCSWPFEGWDPNPHAHSRSDNSRGRQIAFSNSKHRAESLSPPPADADNMTMLHGSPKMSNSEKTKVVDSPSPAAKPPLGGQAPVKGIKFVNRDNSANQEPNREEDQSDQRMSANSQPVYSYIPQKLLERPLAMKDSTEARKDTYSRAAQTAGSVDNPEDQPMLDKHTVDYTVKCVANSVGYDSSLSVMNRSSKNCSPNKIAEHKSPNAVKAKKFNSNGDCTEMDIEVRSCRRGSRT